MDIKCNNCDAAIMKSYGSAVKLRSRHIRWDSLSDTATVQCNLCRSWSNIPLSLKVEGVDLVLEVGTEIRKSSDKAKLIITEKATKRDKAQ